MINDKMMVYVMYKMDKMNKLSSDILIVWCFLWNVWYLNGFVIREYFLKVSRIMLFLV